MSHPFCCPHLQLLIKSTNRDYIFQMQNATECERWATNLVQLAQCAGYTVPGYVVMPEDDKAEAGGIAEGDTVTAVPA